MKYVWGKEYKILLILILFIYIAFLYIDIFNNYLSNLSDILKFISIVLCFTMSMLSSKRAFNLIDVKLLQAGLFLTVMADFTLLLTHGNNEIGIGVFCLVQVVYSIRYDIENRKRTIKKYIIIFIVLAVVYIFDNQFFIKIDLIFLLCIFYGILLVSNVIKAINTYRYKLYPKQNALMVSLGMILFLLCDVNVGLHNLYKMLNMTQGLLYKSSLIAMWLFYLPSQVLLSLSGLRFDKK